MLAGAAVGLAALALPTPLLDLVPGAEPRQALAANNNVADGVYAFRYNATPNTWGLDIYGGASTSSNVTLNKANNSHAQYWIVTYDSSKDGYKIMPVCGQDTGMVLSIKGNSAVKNATVITAADKSRTDQRWILTKNSNGSYSIRSKANTSYCVNLANDNRASEAGIQLYTYSATDIASQWKMDCLITSIAETTETVTLGAVYSSTCRVDNVRKSVPKLTSTLPSGWKAAYDSSGGIDTITYSSGVYRSRTPVTFTVLYPNCADINDSAVDLKLTIKVYGGDLATGSFNYMNTMVDLNWENKNKPLGISHGVCVIRSPGFDLTYNFIDRKTQKTASLKGGRMTFGSLNGGDSGSPTKWGKVLNHCEGISYRAGTTPVKASRTKDHLLMCVCPGFTIGKGPDAFDDWVGSDDFQRYAVTYQIVDDYPTFSARNIVSGNYGDFCCSEWVFPIFSGLGIEKPPSPSKSATITG